MCDHNYQILFKSVNWDEVETGDPLLSMHVDPLLLHVINDLKRLGLKLAPREEWTRSAPDKEWALSGKVYPKFYSNPEAHRYFKERHLQNLMDAGYSVYDSDGGVIRGVAMYKISVSKPLARAKLKPGARIRWL